MNKYTGLIDNYLSGNLNAQDRRAFEQNLETNAALKTEFELRKKLRTGHASSTLKKETKPGTKNGDFITKIGKLFAGIVIFALAIAWVWVIKNKSYPFERQNIRHELNEENNKQWSDADKHLTPEIFLIRADRDTVIASKNGIVFAIPAWSFLNDKADLVEGEVEIEVKEAMNPMDIMKAGLQSTSDGNLLETLGMFYLNARQNGLSLKIAKNKSLYTSVPNRSNRNKMLLFDGKRMGNGQLDWMDPKFFESKLIPEAITGLNFYPPHFLDSLQTFNFDVKNKKLTDGIYYSFSSDTQINGMDAESGYELPHAGSPEKVYRSLKTSPEIDPARIHAIWNEKFNNTLLATKAFEERLQAIFKTCDHQLLDLYRNQLNKKMFEIDSQAAGVAKNPIAFDEFFQRREGAVSLNEPHLKKLQNYIKEKQSGFKEVALITWKKILTKENIADGNALLESLKQNANEKKRFAVLFENELANNITEANGVPGKTGQVQLTSKMIDKVPATKYLSTSIVNMGWKNVALFVTATTIEELADDQSRDLAGAKANIKYGPISVKVNDFGKYDRVYTYLIADKINTYLRVPNKGDTFRENLNGMLGYHAVVFGFTGDAIYYKEIGDVGPGKMTVTLGKAVGGDLDHFRYINTGTFSELIEQLGNQWSGPQESNPKKIIARRNEVRKKMWPVVFPCVEKLDSRKNDRP